MHYPFVLTFMHKQFDQSSLRQESMIAMQENWQRRHAFVSLDTATITHLLQPAFPGQRLVSAEVMSGGLINTNYKIHVSGLAEPYVLRIYMRDHAACQKERDIFQLIHSRVPVPEIIYADTDGLRYVQPYAITTWVEGITLQALLNRGNLQEMSEAAYAVGSVLATISSYTFEQAGFFGQGIVVAQPMLGIADYIKARLDAQAGQRLGPTLTERVWQLVTDNAVRLKEIEGAASLVHSDFQAANILVKQEAGAWTVAAVLDWEWAHSGTTLFDIAILLRHYKQQPTLFEPRFIEGFVRQGGRLPYAWKKLTKLLDLVNLCEFLNGPDSRGTMADDVTNIILDTVENWESFE
jgi:aminoglycoside phosphotransferase (APT) family kinase protein